MLRAKPFPFETVSGNPFPNIAYKMWKQMPGHADKHLFFSGGHCFLQNQADRTWKTTKKFFEKNDLI